MCAILNIGNNIIYITSFNLIYLKINLYYIPFFQAEIS